jgi:hypothetical protein
MAGARNTLMGAETLTAESATGVAVISTTEAAIIAELAVNVTEVVVIFESVPQLVPVHPAPDSDQVTFGLRLGGRTNAVNPCVPPARVAAETGLMATENRVKETDADFVGSAADIAVTVTAPELGSVAGAV